MVAMFVANGTSFLHNFQYTLPERSSPITQPIAPGGQIRIAGDLTVKDVEAIVRQHAPYGMIDVSEIDRTKPFSGLCYSLDKPVTMPRIEKLLMHNREVREEEGKTIREHAAVAATVKTEAALGITGEGGMRMEVEVNEETAGSPSAYDHSATPTRLSVDRTTGDGGKAPDRVTAPRPAQRGGKQAARR